jgi:hypothetical protein
MTRDIKKDRELCSKATPGPWIHDSREDRIYSISENGREQYVCTTDEHVINHWLSNNAADAEFIATSREALPYYINRVEELEVQNANLRDKVSSLRKIVCNNCYQTDKYECAKCRKWFIV